MSNTTRINFLARGDKTTVEKFTPAGKSDEIYIFSRPDRKMLVEIDDHKFVCNFVLLRSSKVVNISSELHLIAGIIQRRQKVLVSYREPVDFYVVENEEGDTTFCDVEGREFLELQ